MSDFFNRLSISKKSGQVIILAALGMVGFVAMIALVTDIGWTYSEKSRLQTAVNAGWKAGYDEVRRLRSISNQPLSASEKDLVVAKIQEVFKANGYSSSDALNLNIASGTIIFGSNDSLTVTTNKSVGMFFANVIGIDSMGVDAKRALDPEGNFSMIPIAIPYGVVKDLSRTTYSVDFFSIDAGTPGFASGTEYLLKLGSGNPPGGGSGTYDPNLKMILVPMNAGSQTTTGFRHAYGVAYWCLKMNEADSGYVPVDWLLGYLGGAFMLPWDPAVETKLTAEGVNYQVITGSDNVQTIYTAVGDHVLSVYNRPKIAIYSSQSSPDPVELVLQGAKIPYGTYEPLRNEAYSAVSCTRLFDTEIIGNGLDSYNWLHLHHEDFTGFTGGCAYIGKTCRAWDSWPGGLVKTSSDTNDLCAYCRDFYFNSTNPSSWGWATSVSYLNSSCSKYSTRRSCKSLDQAGWTYTKTASTTTDLCNYCRNFYFYKSQNNWNSPHGSPGMTYNQANCSAYIAGATSANRTCKYYDINIKAYINKTQTMCAYCSGFYAKFNTNNWTTPKTRTYNPTSCENWGLRCAEKASSNGVRYINKVNLNTKICRQGDNERPQCRSYLGNFNTATTLGYSDDPGYLRTRKLLYNSTTLVNPNGSKPLAADSSIILNPGRVQKLKWDVAQKIHDHVNAGGFLFAQCFAPETLDVALWQKKVFEEQRTGPQATQNAAYDYCFAFSGFAYKAFYNAYDAPGAYNGEYYSGINANNTSAFTLSDTYDPRCQNHSGANPRGGSGHCDSFVKNVVKGTQDNVTILGVISRTVVNYVKGTVGTGEFCFMGGHSHPNIQTERLVLNNVLLGAISTKEIGGGGGIAGGQQKNNYGVVDPDNYVSGGANDYRDRLSNGFNAPIQLSDRIIPEPGNMVGPTDQGVAARVATFTSRFVVVPITDIPPEVPGNNPQNASASAIYDLQGQDHPDGVYDPASYSFGSSVRIIGFALFEVIEPTEYTRAGPIILPGDTGDLGSYQSGQIRGRFVRYIVKPGEMPIN